ncbi:hypothetical protein WSM22_45130 [Cytophagales bacterium WSM2-2]|nr:hypothetical protein WSM22_45130 [Cytophagales bacterium WSM2-2]
MKHFFFVFSIVAVGLLTTVTSCNNNSSTSSTLLGAWDKMGDFEGIPRSGAVGFVINGYAYVGCGYNALSNTWLKDVWRYDAAADTWFRVTDFPGAGRVNAVGFSINGKGYIGTGTGDGFTGMADFYEFDPSSGPKGSWRRVADFGFNPTDPIDAGSNSRYGALAFTVKNRAFVGSGTDITGGSYKDLWEYDQTNNVWIRRPSIGGSKRSYAFTMVIGDYVYVGGGIDNGQVATDLQRFDVTGVDNGIAWTPMNGLTGKDINGNIIAQPKSRSVSTTFTVGNFGYLTCGSLASTLGVSSDMWQYDPSKDLWTQYYSFATNTPVIGSARNSAVGFALTTPTGTYGYITTGGTSSTLRYDDCWRFDPSGIEPDNK